MEGAQVPAVDPDEARGQAFGTYPRLRRREAPPARSSRASRPRRASPRASPFQQGGDEEHRVRPHPPRDLDVLHVQEEVLSQHRKVRERLLDPAQVLQGAVEAVLLREDGDAARPGSAYRRPAPPRPGPVRFPPGTASGVSPRRRRRDRRRTAPAARCGRPAARAHRRAPAIGCAAAEGLRSPAGRWRRCRALTPPCTRRPPLDAGLDRCSSIRQGRASLHRLPRPQVGVPDVPCDSADVERRSRVQQDGFPDRGRRRPPEGHGRSCAFCTAVPRAGPPRCTAYSELFRVRA